MIDLSIIIVPYKSRDDLDVALTAVFNSQTNYSYEVIMVDNDPQDGTDVMVKEKYLSRPDIAAKITYLPQSENLGFGTANNLGMQQAKGEYILLLNPDTKLDPANLEVMINFMKSRSDVGIATCKLLRGNGELDWASRRMEPTLTTSFLRLSGLQFIFPKWFGKYNVMNKDINQETEIDACVGAYMMISRKCYDTIGGFDDQNFFMYGEDLDLCKRAREAGFKIWYYPKTVCMHYKGQSSAKRPQKSLYEFHDVMWKYYKKHYSKKYFHLMDPFVYIGVWGRYYWKSFRNMFRKKKYVSK